MHEHLFPLSGKSGTRIILDHREVEFMSADENKQGWWQTLPG